MKRTLGITLAVALAISAVSAPAVAGNGYGKQIKDECGLSYGQLVSAGKKAARAGGHPAFIPSGAKAFVTEPIAALGGLTLLEAHLAVGACPNSED